MFDINNVNNETIVTVNKVETTVATESFKKSFEEDTTFDIIQAFDFDVKDMGTGDSVVLSFYIGDSALKASDFTIYHKSSDKEDWNEAKDITDIAYDGTTLSFIVKHFSAYGFTATTVPEPAEWAAILGSLALGFAIYRRRK